MTEAPQWLIDMPKTDLHRHLGGSIRLQTLLELADMYGVALPENVEQKIRAKNHQSKSLTSYLDAIKICESVFVKPDAFQRVAYEVCEDAAKENIRILELRFGPTNYMHDHMKLYEIVEATLDGLKKGGKDFNIHTGLIICGIRTDFEATRKAAEIAINYQPGVIGFDLAGKEAGHRPKQFQGILKPVLENFLPITIHAGEDDTVASIAEALIYLNAQRIGHGVTMLQSTKLLDYVNKMRVGVELCITSNIDTGSVAAIETHPARVFYQNDLRITINTDNPTISDTTITKEYLLLMEHLGFLQEDIYRLAKNGIKAAFLDSRETKQYLDEFDAITGNGRQ